MNNYFSTSAAKRKRSVSFQADNIVLREPSHTIRNGHHSNDKNALANYNFWLGERNAVHQKLKKKIDRESGDLLMNTGDQLNEIREDKAALEYTKIPQEFDKYRGNPEWFEFPPGLHDRCRCRRDRVKYFYKKTKVQKNEIPEIERVGLPNFIKYEKMLFPRTKNIYQKWLDLEYRKKRVEELSAKLERITPHKPIFDNLVVIGKRIQPPVEEYQTTAVPERHSTASRDRRKTSVYDISLKLCLKINGVFFFENSPTLGTSRKFNVLFEYDVQCSPVQTQYITFENVGRVTIRIYWKEMKKFRLFQDIIRATTTETFCFDKNMLILVPGQIVNFPVWFQTKKVCTVVETWQITTVPEFWCEPVRVFFVLQAQTHIEHFMKKIKEIKINIHQIVKMRIIKELIDEAMEKTKYEDYKTIDYSYYEPELFEASNFEDSNLERKPKYIYDKYIVEQLKIFYDNVRQAYHPKTWDFNVCNLRVLARVKDLIGYAEERTTEYSQYRMLVTKESSHTDLGNERKDKRNSSDSSKMKLKKTSIPSQNEIDHFVHKQTCYGTLMKLLWKLSPPSINLNSERVKYFQVYSVLCAYFTQMDNALSYVKPFYNNSTTYNNNLYENCERLIFEKFDELQLIRTKRSFYDDNSAKPKPHILKNVSSHDIHRIHKLYFNQSIPEFTVSADKFKTEKTPKNKEKQKPAKGINSTSSGNIGNNLSENDLDTVDFDPYVESSIISIPNKSSTSMKKFSSIDIARSSCTNSECATSENIQSLNIYVTIYSYLEKAVDAMVDTLESAKEFRVPHKNLEQLKECFKLFVDDEKTEKEVTSINPFVDREDREYFEKILSAHLNDVTTTYLVCGKTVPIAKEDQAPNTGWSVSRPSRGGSDKVLEHLPKTISMFTLPRFEPEEVSYREREAQTLAMTTWNEMQLTKEHLRKLEKDEDICQCPSEYRELPIREPDDHFYYSADEIFDGADVTPHKSVSRVSVKAQPSATHTSDEQPDEIEYLEDQHPYKKTSLSLLREWSRKKCLRNTNDDDLLMDT